MNKYELTDETKEWRGITLHRIKALKNIGDDVKAGDMGGWIQSEKNLSQHGDAWVYDNAKVYGNAWVYDNAWVCDNAEVYDNAKVYGNAWVYDNAEVRCNAEIYNLADVLTISPIGSRGDVTTFYRAREGKIYVKCGCKNTDIDTWLGMVEQTYGENKYGQAYRLAAQIAKLQIGG